METLSLYPDTYKALKAAGILVVPVSAPSKFPVGKSVLVACVSVTTWRPAGECLMAKVKHVTPRGASALVSLEVQPSAPRVDDVQVAP